MIEEQELQTIQMAEESSFVEVEAREPPPSSRASSLAASRQRAYAADLTKAHVALMEREVILPKQLELFRLVNRHYRTLQTWHDQYTGWRILRSPTVIRLIRQPGAMTPGYLYDRLKEPNDFACLVWILWYAENRQLTGHGNDQQFLLSQLAEQVQEQSAAGTESERRFDFRKQADRYSIQRALQYLEDLGGLQLVDGQTREWVEQIADADVLYEFTDVIHSLVAALDPQIVEAVSARLQDTTTVLQPTLLSGRDGMDGIVLGSTTSGGMAPTRNATTPLVRAWRPLLLGPALFRFDDPSAFAELLEHADAVANELLDTFGWLLDIHKDYACIVRPSGTSTGPVTSLTPYGTNDQIALLVCGAMRSQVESGVWPKPDMYGCLHVTTEDMTELFYAVRERYGESWGTEARNKSSRSLLNDVYRKMRQAGLLRGPDEAGNILILPTAARYAATYDKAGQETKKSQRNRKDGPRLQQLEMLDAER
ncbi:MAG TPA: TIGR02678 family protein [Ktedonobacteraceae bacterium]|nr:TIGR02678 family protein [Ktedonobacteraceae bacterium]